MFEINWKPLSEITFSEEMNFILSKWNQIEVDKFAILVEENLDRLSKTPTIGIYKSEYNCYKLVISKQTTLYYKIIENKSQIDLIFFWNNSQNPKLIAKLLK
jgi:plasmid stabilization system protein ParE